MLFDPDAGGMEFDDLVAAAVADRLLRDVGTRLAHSAGVAAQVQRVGGLLDGSWRLAVIEAAWLHDAGYNERLALTGFHPLDGARWLRDHCWPGKTCRLVAWHSAAATEGALRGLDHELAGEFEPPPWLAGAALTWADLTSSPSGERWAVGRRLADILRRHPTDSVAHRATVAALPALWGAAREIEALLASEWEER